MALCIFCDAELTATTKPEHVLLTALGGRKSTRRADCSHHNNLFGGGIDKAITDQVPEIRNLLQLESGTGKPPPGLKGVEAGNEVLNIAPDGTPRVVAKPFEITHLPDGRFNLSIGVNSEEELQRIVPHIAAQLRMTEAALWDQLSKVRGTVVRRRPAPLHFPLTFGGLDAVRSITKSCLVLLASLVDTEPLRAEPFASARQFVPEGDDTFNLTRASLDPRSLPCVEALKAKYGPLFNLIYVRSDEHGRTVGHFTLYNVIAWQVVLAESGGPPSVKIALASNPLNPACWSGEAAEEFDVDFDWLNNPDRTDHIAKSKARLEAMALHYFEASRSRALDKIMKEAFERQRRPGQTVLDEEQSQRAFAESIHRYAHLMLDVPTVEEFSPTPPGPSDPPEEAG